MICSLFAHIFYVLLAAAANKKMKKIGICSSLLQISQVAQLNYVINVDMPGIVFGLFYSYKRKKIKV